MLAGAVVVLATASPVLGMPLFASPPHFVAGDEQRQIVFFLNEAVQGALAVRAADDAVDVIVPESRVDPTVQGDSFQDAEARIRRLVMSAAAHGATTIRIETKGPAGRVSARPADDPPRLIVVLSDVEEERAAAPATSAAVATARPTALAPTKTPISTGAPAASATAPPTQRPTATATQTSSRSATPQPAVTPIAVRLPKAGERGVRIADALGAANVSGAEVLAPVSAVRAGDEGLPCVWRRWYGVPFCAPDPRESVYAADSETAALATSLATPGAKPLSVPAGESPALDYLRADSVYVAHARTGRMLGAITAYRRVLRRHPTFVDASRVRLNIALAYRAMGFEGELRAAAEIAESGATGTLLRALAGDVALEAGAMERARGDYAAVATKGDFGACLAARGRLAVTLEGGGGGDVGEAVREIEKRCPRALLEDPETQLLRARVHLAAGDLEGATALLSELSEHVPMRSRARVIATRGAVAESAGDRAAARAAYEELAKGAYGTRAAQSASARLALLDAADGDIEAGLRRLRTFEPSSSEDTRRALVTGALAALDGTESPSRAIALVHEAGIEPDALPLTGQIRLARAYRRLGLHARATHVLEGARRRAGPNAPAALWIESAHVAQARGGWPAVLKIADAWVASDASSPQAVAMRARALAGVGKARTAVEVLAYAATKLESSEVRDLRIEVGSLLREHDPEATQRLLEEAATADVAPALPPSRAAELLWDLGDVAEANGDDAAARAVFAQLVRRYPTEPAASLAAYRYGRLAATVEPAGAYDDALSARGGLERRAAEAAREFEAVVATLAPTEAP